MRLYLNMGYRLLILMVMTLWLTSPSSPPPPPSYLSGRRDLLSCLLTLSHERAGRGEQIYPLGELIKPIRELITWCLIPGIVDKMPLAKQLMLQDKGNVRDCKTKAGGYGRPKGYHLDACQQR